LVGDPFWQIRWFEISWENQEERGMRVKLRIKKDGAAWFEGVYDVVDAASFGETCADAWAQLREHKLQTATSIGALYGTLDEHLLDELQGAEISFGKA
jgi:hypothetical protein